jgi:hypothetical protein
MVEKSAIERIKELDEERARIFEHAKQEALQKANQAVADLNALGLDYELVSRDRKGGRRPTSASTPRGTVKSAPCPICEFETSPPHDARSHRGQKTKKPFAAAELKEKGMEKV